MELFMNVEATPAQIRAARSAIRRSRAVDAFAFVSQADAFREFRRLFADQPDLVTTTDQRTLPASFQIKPVDGAQRARLIRSLEQLAGADEVKTSA
jgi:cell division transport system permease protein